MPKSRLLQMHQTSQIRRHLNERCDDKWSDLHIRTIQTYRITMPRSHSPRCLKQAPIPLQNEHTCTELAISANDDRLLKAVQSISIGASTVPVPLPSNAKKLALLESECMPGSSFTTAGMEMSTSCNAASTSSIGTTGCPLFRVWDCFRGSGLTLTMPEL